MVKSETRRGRTGGSRGYTLVELIIVLFIMAVVAAAVYTLFARQQKTYTTQDMVVEMQQNVRAAVDMMVRELRMAGNDPDYTRPTRGTEPVGIKDATKQKIRFTYANKDGTAVEDITYALYQDTKDNIWKLGRGTGSASPALFPIVERVVDFSLEYMIIADGSFRGISGKPNEVGGLQRIIWDEIPGQKEKEICESDLCKSQCANCKLGIRVVRVSMTVQTPYADLNSPTGRFPTYRLVTDVAMRNLSYIDPVR